MDTTPRYRLGLVLSGGGARGFAHIGVVQAMYEAGLRPRYHLGHQCRLDCRSHDCRRSYPRRMFEFFPGEKNFAFARPTMSKKGIMIMNGMEERLAEFLHVKTFEELKIPLVITASDINGAVPVHFEKGELLPCIIASCSIPVVFTPREIDHVDYVDGGVFMNLPVRPIRKRCEKIIAVEINSIDTSEKITNMIGMAIRSFHLGLDRNTDIDRNMCDVFISPQNMTKYSMFDLEHIREIYEEGYLTAKRILKNSILQTRHQVLA